LFVPIVGTCPAPPRLWLRGTNFQIKVWEALMHIPPGRLASYGALAAAIGEPRAARAVGRALADNPVGWLVPCHRVIRASGRFETGYRWGSARKRAMIAWEAAQAEENDAAA
jgi:AraC family transcriptional regulator of adaptative response/methylated-DNA-[protein]-cysteine methyltransferase